jgi:RimJ/RimL family protein N-acetyltransferase
MGWVAKPHLTDCEPIAVHWIGADGPANAKLRRLDGRDLAGIETHLLDLDLVSRNRRFGSGFGDAAVAAYVRRLDPATDILFGAIEEDSGRIVGLAEAHPAGAAHAVEIGTSVLASHRRRGLARELVARAVATAVAQGATAVELLFDPTNTAAARIAAGLGASLCAPGRAVLRARQADHPMLCAADEPCTRNVTNSYGISIDARK